jgi:hypothetical protein
VGLEAVVAWRALAGWKIVQRQRGDRSKFKKCCSGCEESARRLKKRAHAGWKMLQRQRGGRTKGMKVGKCCNGSEEGARRLENAAEVEWWAHESTKDVNAAEAAWRAHEGHESWNGTLLHA